MEQQIGKGKNTTIDGQTSAEEQSSQTPKDGVSAHPRSTKASPRTLITLPTEIEGEISKADQALSFPPTNEHLTFTKGAVYTWLFRHIDVDFAGAEARGTARLLQNLKDIKLNNGYYVKQLTVAMGPFKFDRGAHAIEDYPDLRFNTVYRWNTFLPPNEAIYVGIRNNKNIKKLHMTMLLRNVEDVNDVVRYLRLGMHEMSFTFSHPGSSLLEWFDPNENQLQRLLRWTIPRQLTQDDTEGDELMQEDPNEGKAEPLAAVDRRSHEKSMPTIKSAYFDNFNGKKSNDPSECSNRDIFVKLLGSINLSKLSLLGFRRCLNADELLTPLVEKTGALELKTIRIVDVPRQEGTSARVHSLARGYGLVLSRCSGLEEVVLDDQSFTNRFVERLAKVSGRTLRILELHNNPPDAKHLEDRTYPTKVQVDDHELSGTKALKKLAKHCPGLEKLSIDMLPEEFERLVSSTARIQPGAGLLTGNAGYRSAGAPEAENDKALAKLEITYRSVGDPYPTARNRFGPEEPLSSRTPEEFLFEWKPRVEDCELRWTAKYLDGHLVIEDAWQGQKKLPREKLVTWMSKFFGIRFAPPPAGAEGLRYVLQAEQECLEQAMYWMDRFRQVFGM
ncbi:MAG: hypothetical protein Q9203_002960 [Teloschistes exilis]